jgi:hypothetical protein
MICYFLSDIFTAEFAENAENKLNFGRNPDDFLCVLCDLERSPAERDASTRGELKSKQ